MDFSLIIPTYKREKILIATLRSAQIATAQYNSEIIIVNDSDEDINISKEDLGNSIVINNAGKGVASARNSGAKVAKSDLLIFIDDDILIFKDNIETVLSLHAKFQSSCFNLNWTYPPKLIEKIKKKQFGRYLIRYNWTSLKGWHKGLHWRDNEMFESDMIASFFLTIKKEDFDYLGGYNEVFPLAGAEDFEFAQRVKKSKIKGYCYPLSTVYHNEADRTEPLHWLKRKENAAKTRRIATNMGYHQMGININPFKKKLAAFGSKTLPIWYQALRLIPNLHIFDPVYNKIVNFLIVSHIHKGYHS